MASTLEYAASAELRRVPEPDDPRGPSVQRVLAMFDHQLAAGGAAFSGGTLVRLAEAAFDFGESARAYRALEEYLGSSPPRDQHWVRAMYVHGQLRGREAAGAVGARRAALVRQALALVLQGLSVAESGGGGSGEEGAADGAAAYAFLV
jgi:hypothetical protein